MIHVYCFPEGLCCIGTKLWHLTISMIVSTVVTIECCFFSIDCDLFVVTQYLWQVATKPDINYELCPCLLAEWYSIITKAIYSDTTCQKKCHRQAIYCWHQMCLNFRRNSKNDVLHRIGQYQPVYNSRIVLGRRTDFADSSAVWTIYSANTSLKL